MNLAEKLVLITGASSGIGAAVAMEFAKQSEGNIKLLLGARRVSNLEELKVKLISKYPGIDVLCKFLDVSNSESVKSFWNSLPEEWRSVDILVNNAGNALGQSRVGDIEEDDVDECFETNVLGLIKMTQYALKGTLLKNKGDIVQIGSIAGREAYPTGSIYCSTKYALKGFTESLRKELITTKIRVIEVAPGNIKTEFPSFRFKGDSEKSKKVYAGTTP
ncbi:CPA_1a_G0016950.mRNA.1.CDS.1 [Saccharomyces cerevisiae]|nr:CPA_1a_G0016950.mRNA.1.CDS.1 [Saccharomyces cerevisiae]CAI5258202.1 AEL_HP2_G0025650.mRNA.1.CDS.1 [Saccharomyces cerevisiae]CAI6459616.1 AEL_HP2_G0025650.mRNA.1.CDS.1 [Saccharomyces cerevisiae]CAI7275364.1 CPA_1a_G0016950.mRNA.1.CDS.1 [Saccharomyces cerevisiae]